MVPKNPTVPTGEMELRGSPAARGCMMTSPPDTRVAFPQTPPKGLRALLWADIAAVSTGNSSNNRRTVDIFFVFSNVIPILTSLAGICSVLYFSNTSLRGGNGILEAPRNKGWRFAERPGTRCTSANDSRRAPGTLARVSFLTVQVLQIKCAAWSVK